MNSTTIARMDLESGKVNEINWPDSERVRMLGYLNESLIYGVADTADIDVTQEGNELFPMKPGEYCG